MKSAHISFDDVFGSLRWLKVNHPASLFDMGFWGNLKKLHNKYNAVFSLYTFQSHDGFDIGMLPNVYKDELRQSTSWLRFGFHAASPKTNALQMNADDFCDSLVRFNEVMSKVMPIERLCKWIRLHNWCATKEQVDIMKSKGITSLLCRDNAGVSYDLDMKETELLNAQGSLCKNGIKYRRTNIRYDDCPDIEFELNELIKEGKEEIVLFGHERHFRRSLPQIEYSISTLRRYGYKFVND